MVALALRGIGIEQKVSLSPTYLNGTIAQREHEIVLRQFGSEDALIVMLRGPRQAVDLQGQKLASELEALPRSLVATPWTPGSAIKGLRPSPGVAALIVSLGHRQGEKASDVAVPVQRAVARSVQSPVRASVTGTPAYSNSFQSATEHAVSLGERVALPVLLIVLLLVFRSVLAALIPAVIGGVVVAATRGVLDLLISVVRVESFAVAAVGMMGLALGVDYSLLVVSRFREEMRKDDDVAEAVRATVMATGRSVLPAATGLVLAMLVASQVVPGAIGVPVSVAIIAATVLSALAAVFVVPSFLMMFGSRLDRWALPERRRAGPSARSAWLVNRPALALPIIFVLFLLSAWAFTLDTRTSTFSLLPPEDSGRRQNEAIQHTLGPGWTSPMEIVMDGGAKPVTTPHRLRELASFQHKVERDPGVKAMAGFAALEHGAEQFGGIERTLVDQEHGVTRLGAGLVRARAGAALNTTGLSVAATGARRLESAIGGARAGAGILAGGLRAAGGGSDRLNQGLSHAGEGSDRLAQGTAKASAGLERLSQALAKAEEKTGETSNSARLIKNAMRTGQEGLADLREPLRSVEGDLSVARQGLLEMSSGRTDPRYAGTLQAVEEAAKSLTGTDPQTGEPVAPSYEGVGSGVERAEGRFGLGLYLADKVDQSAHKGSEGARKLARLSSRLDRGFSHLAEASRRISTGIGRLSQGGETISPGLRRLSHGALSLTSGLTALQTGSGGLAGGLGGAAQRSKLLTGALSRIGAGVKRSNPGRSGLSQLREQSPGLFHSGYFYLAALDGSRPQRRDQAGFLVDLDHGGHAARMLVIPRSEPETSQAEATTARLQADADDLARTTGTRVLVGGFGPAESDVNQALRDQAPLTRLSLSLVTFLILIPVVRSLVLPLMAALINLLTLGATFGALALLFNGSFLGGPGYVEVGVIPTTMVVIFGLAIDYEVFIFSRIREEYVRTGSPSAAITNGLARIGHVVTGAALIMIAVFLAFAVSPFPVLREFGVAQAIAVFIDAFMVRLIVVPSLMRMLGRRAWWIPAWLDRLLPGGAPVAVGADR